MPITGSGYETGQSPGVDTDEEGKMARYNYPMQRRKKRFRKARGSKGKNIENTPEQSPAKSDDPADDRFEIAQT